MQPKQPNSKKNIVIVVALLIIGAGVYFYMSGSPTDIDPSLSVEGGASAPTDADASAARVLSLLTQIKNIKIDSTFFTSDAYSSLVDHTVPIYEQSVGKSNPFSNPNPRPATR